MSQWFTPEQASLIGAIGGASIGVLGGVVGSLAGYLVPRGKGKPVVVGLFVSLIVVGVGALLATTAGLVVGQPRHVVYPLGLLGLVAAPIGGALLPVVLRRYRHAEQRRLEAAELRRG